ncbi:MAG: hypothetical protein K8F52_14750 [Candidatus Scalindua rubra]|nr:hypothetical protein [Candidatus Scalindua rubra]
MDIKKVSVLKNPFDDEYKTLLKDFSSLLRSIVATIDKYGLKARFLKKHKRDANTFYKKILHESRSELVIKYQKKV